MDFKELTKKDAQITLAMELDKLMKTMPEGQKHVVEQDFDGFQRLFSKFINETGPSVVWDKIEKLPQNAVSLDKINFDNDSLNSFYRSSLMPTYPTQKIRRPSAPCWTSWWSSSSTVGWGLPWAVAAQSRSFLCAMS